MIEANNLPTDVNTNSINASELNKDISELAQQLIDEKDVDASKNIVQLFNFNLSKRNALRILKLNGLYDSITDQMIERFQKRSGEFSNSDLLSYLQTVENSIEKSQKSLSQVDEQPTIVQTNNTQVNFNVLDGFNDDSRDRIANAIKSILNSAATADTVEAAYTEIPTENGEQIKDEQFTDDDKWNSLWFYK